MPKFEILFGNLKTKNDQKQRPENAIPISGFWEAKPFIFAWIFPMDSSEYPQLKDSIEKLILNDSRS